jgi:hypothetical protein
VNAPAQQGQCRCGAVRFEASGRPLITMACHCSGCQRMTGSAYSLSSLYAWSDFRLVEGEPVIGGLKAGTRHYFCPSCMSWLYTRPEGMDDYVNIRSSMFEDAAGHAPYMETWFAEALPGAVSGAVKRFETVPEPDQFGPLVAAYGEWSGATANSSKEDGA